MSEVAAAEARAALARERLQQTVGELQARATPQALADKAKVEAVKGGRAAVDSAARHPAAAAGVVGFAIAFLARKPLARLFGRAKPAERSDVQKHHTARRAGKDHHD